MDNRSTDDGAPAAFRRHRLNLLSGVSLAIATTALIGTPSHTDAVSLPVITHPMMIPTVQVAGTRVVTQSTNWSGYVDEAPGYTPVLDAHGHWRVPQVSVGPGSQFSAIWVGFGGTRGDETLVQAGTEQDNLNGHARYYAWITSEASTYVATSVFSVSPGDLVSVDLWTEEFGPGLVSGNISDANSGASINFQRQGPSSALTAEWILERPLVDGTLSTLASTAPVTMTSVWDNSVLPFSAPPTPVTAYTPLTMTGVGGSSTIAAPSGFGGTPWYSQCFQIADGAPPPPAAC